MVAVLVVISKQKYHSLGTRLLLYAPDPVSLDKNLEMSTYLKTMKDAMFVESTNNSNQPPKYMPSPGANSNKYVQEPDSAMA